MAVRASLRPVARRGHAVSVALGQLALLVWLLGVAGWISVSAVGEWVAFGLGLGLLAAGRVALAVGGR